MMSQQIIFFAPSRLSTFWLFRIKKNNFSQSQHQGFFHRELERASILLGLELCWFRNLENCQRAHWAYVILSFFRAFMIKAFLSSLIVP